MAINKNFVIKNGVEVNTSLIVGDATLNKVGVGTTVPGYTLHVGGSRGGIGATDLTVTGIATVGTSGSTSAALSVVGVSSFQGDVNFLGSAGVSTITFDASLDKLNFADNARATFGAGDDLQIFHDGSNSIIRETGTGNIVLEGSGETLAVFADDGAVSLYYDNENVFQTTPQGVNVSGVTTSNRLNISGVSTFTSIGSNLIPDGDGSRNIGSAGSEWQDLHIDGTANIDTLAADTAAIGDLTENRVVIAGSSGELEDDSNFTFDGTTLAVTGKETVSVDITVGSGVTIQNHGGLSVAGISTFGGLVNVDGGITANTAIVEDLTNNRVVIAGSGGELEDSANLTFNGSTLAVTGDETVSGKVSVGSGVTAFANGNLAVAGISTFNGNVLVGTGITIQPHGGVSIAGIVTVGGDLNVQGDIVYDEITGRNLNITGISTQAGQVNFGTSGVGATVFANGNVAISGVTTSNGGIIVGTAVTIQSNGAAAFVGVVTAGTALVTGSAKVEDLTDNRVVLAGTDGELEDSANLTFDGAGLVVTGNANVSGVSTFSDDLIVGVSTLVVEVTNGRIGIGTAVPSRKVEIFDTAATVLQLNSTNASGTSLRIQNSGTDKTFVGLAGDFITGQANNVTDSAIRASGALLFASGGGTERLRVSSGGNIGINTTNPTSYGNSQATLVIEDDTNPAICISDTGQTRDWWLVGLGDGLTVRYADGGGSGSASNVTNSMFFKNDGSIGISTATPRDSSTLDVDGGGRFNGDVGFSGSTGAGSTVLFDQSDNSLKFVDNAKAKFGSGGDLEVYHDGTHSHIREVGTGDLRLRSDKIQLMNDSSQEYFVGNSGGSVELYHNDAKRFETTTDGADFSGTGSIKIPVGTTAQRNASPVAGDFRYNSTLGQFEGYTDSWGEIGGSGGVSETDTSVSTTTATGVGSFAVATHRSAAIIAQIDQGGSYQVGRYLMIHDGTTATVIEESAIATGDMLGSFTADVNNSNAELKVTMNSSGIATVTTKIDTVTV